MSYAKALSSKKSQTATQETRVYAYAHAVKALWGDITMYNPAEDGDHKTFFNESAAKRLRFLEASKENTRTPEQVFADQERLQEKAAIREQLQRQARAKEFLFNWVRSKVRKIRARVAQRATRFAHLTKCKCGCGRLAHSQQNMNGFCCQWCGKHSGRRGHGQACEGISATTFLKLP
jgi:hypothetical protein